MQIISTEMLIDMRELPLAAHATLAALGLFLWSVGWWLHRFWIVVGSTLAAGLYGLWIGPQYGIEPLVAGLLAAVAAGGLALSLARVLVFAGCGLGCWLLMEAAAPSLAEPLVCVLVGGLLGVLLFRFWIVVVSCFAGATLMMFGGAALSEKFLGFNVIQWIQANEQTANIIFAAFVIAGVLSQYILEKWRAKFVKWREEIKKVEEEEKAAPESKKWIPTLRKAG